jgi:hypothetical protein
MYITPMNETVTLDQLILYLYNETEMSDTVMVQKAIDNHVEVEEEFSNLIAARDLDRPHVNECFSEKHCDHYGLCKPDCSLAAGLKKE